MSNVPTVPITNWELDQGMMGRFTIRYSCPNPNCGSKLSSPVTDSGKADSCPDCGCLFILPLEASRAVDGLKRETDAKKLAEQKAKKLAQEESRRKREADGRAEQEEQDRVRQQQQAARAAIEAAAEARRQQYLQTVNSHRRKYKVMLADSTQSAEHTCNYMGFEGWDLEQSFPDTFTYQQCCGPVNKRQIVLIFSQPLDVEAVP